MTSDNSDEGQKLDRAAYSDEDLKKLDAACKPGDRWCTNGLVHKCNSKGKWYATGEKC